MGSEMCIRDRCGFVPVSRWCDEYAWTWVPGWRMAVLRTPISFSSRAQEAQAATFEIAPDRLGPCGDQRERRVNSVATWDGLAETTFKHEY